jgi:hypothetical protein
LIWQQKANEILDEPEREKQVALYKALPKEIQAEVGELVRKEKLANRDFRTYGWRVVWLRQKNASTSG